MCFYVWTTLWPSSIPTNAADDIFPLYKISYMWYSVISVSTVIVVGMIVSFLSGTVTTMKLLIIDEWRILFSSINFCLSQGFHKIEDIDPDLLSPLTKWLLKIKSKDSKSSLELSDWKNKANSFVSKPNNPTLWRVFFDSLTVCLICSF